MKFFKNKVFLFIVCLVALLAFQYKAVMPLLYDIAASDLFLVDSDDKLNRVSTNTPMTDYAFDQCNSYIANELFPEHSFTFPDQPRNAFSLGNYEYLINSDIEILPAEAASYTKRYACRIKYDNEEDTTGLADISNWSIKGISGLDDI
jgi:hypothetical protein